jgi:hypothetical protein
MKPIEPVRSRTRNAKINMYPKYRIFDTSLSVSNRVLK